MPRYQGYHPFNRTHKRTAPDIILNEMDGEILILRTDKEFENGESLK
jgi:hypothetical protein